MQKELSERRVKMIVQKLESHMKNNLGVSQDQINVIGSLNDDEREALF